MQKLQDLKEGVIKEFRIVDLCNLETCEETGIAVVFTLSGKFAYNDKVLKDWQLKLNAEDYIINIRQNQLFVRYNIMYWKETL